MIDKCSDTYFKMSKYNGNCRFYVEGMKPLTFSQCGVVGAVISVTKRRVKVLVDMRHVGSE